MIYLFDQEAIIVMWRNKKLDLVPFTVTVLCGLFISLEYGILIGIGINLLFVLYPSARPKLNTVNEKIPNYQGNVFVVTPKDTLYFPAAEYSINTVTGCEDNNDIVVVDGSLIQNIDITIATSMISFTREMVRKERKLIFWNFKASIADICIRIDRKIRNHFKTGN